MTDNDPLIGRKLSNFRIERVLGRGGMAQVYYGQDVKLQRPVAIKVIDARYRGKPAYAQRFIKEAQAIAGWRHENIIQIYYADDQDGLYYYVMEYIDGQDLAGLMSAHATWGDLLSDAEILHIGGAIASALDYAHSQGIIHRDVKPSNVLMSKEGRVIISDFGLALNLQQGSSGEAFGTPNYISPEQARRSTDAVPQSDLYSLGIILYEMLSGVVPFDDESPTSIALQHITQPPPSPRSLNPQISAETEAVLLKTLSKNPEDRYQTGAALMEAIKKSLSNTKPAPERVLPLPPMPAAILAGKTRSVTRKVTPSVKPVDTKRPWLLFFSLLTILLIAILAVRSGMRPAAFAAMIFPPTLTSFPTQTVLAATTTESATLAPLVVILPSETATVTILPSDTAMTTSTVTAAEGAPVPDTATVTPATTLAAAPGIVPLSGLTQTVTPAGPTATITITPSITTTQEHVNYRRMWLYYDQYGLYIYNASGANRSISPLALERLTKNGTPLNRFEGTRWAEFAPTLYSQHCMRIEIQGNPDAYLNPPLCKDYYLSTRSIPADSDLIFWTVESDSTEFRVLWKNEPVGKCEIAAGFCEVFVP